jgi:hypothetical protein
MRRDRIGRMVVGTMIVHTIDRRHESKHESDGDQRRPPDPPYHERARPPLDSAEIRSSRDPYRVQDQKPSPRASAASPYRSPSRRPLRIIRPPKPDHTATAIPTARQSQPPSGSTRPNTPPPPGSSPPPLPPTPLPPHDRDTDVNPYTAAKPMSTAPGHVRQGPPALSNGSGPHRTTTADDRVDDRPPSLRTPKAPRTRFTMRTEKQELEKLGRVFQGTSTMQDYDMGDKLGEGTFGVVTKATEKVGGAVVALKKLITHNPRDGVSCWSSFKGCRAEDPPGIGYNRSRNQNLESAGARECGAYQSHGCPPQ